MNVLKLKNLLENYKDTGMENWILSRELMQSDQGLKIQLSNNSENYSTYKHIHGFTIAPPLRVPFSSVIGNDTSFGESKASILDISDRGDQLRFSVNRPSLLNYGITYSISINNVSYYKDKNKSFTEVFGHGFSIPRDSTIIIKEIDWDENKVNEFEDVFGLDSSEREFHRIESSFKSFFNFFHPNTNFLDFLSSLIKDESKIFSLKDFSNDIGFLSVLREYINELVFAPASLSHIESIFQVRQIQEESFNKELRSQLKIDILSDNVADMREQK